eukprot:13829641-Alexandrium_andersonii.AAC.1
MRIVLNVLVGCLLLSPVLLSLFGLASRAWERPRNAQVLDRRLFLRRYFELLGTPPLSGRASTLDPRLIVLN